jgi:flagellar motor switch protein FliN
MTDSLTLSESGMKVLNELFSLWAQASQDILSTITSSTVKMSGGELVFLSREEFVKKYESTAMVIQELTFSGEVLGPAFMIQMKETASVLIDLIIGGDGSEIIDEFGELHFSIFSEITSQMMNSLVGVISTNAMKKVNILPREVKLNDLSIVHENNLAELTYEIGIEGKMKGNLWIIFPQSMFRSLAQVLTESTERATQKTPVSESGDAAHIDAAPAVVTQPAVFAQLSQPQEKARGENLELILDIPVHIKAVLGKADLTIKELVELTPGKILELDKLAGEPVDLVVNERLVAHGEIIVIDEKFGVKVMDVLSKAERLYNLR